MPDLNTLLKKIHDCQHCITHLSHGVRPVVQLHSKAKILIVGQAPGLKVHESGIPFDDASGERLRVWLGINADTFYDPTKVVIVPMGFCYPGKGKTGDLPPRPECALKWRSEVLSNLTEVKLTIVIGQYAQQYHLAHKYASLTAAVQDWANLLPNQLAIPHPSPRNNIWLKRHPWFVADVVPVLQQRVHAVLAGLS